MVLPLDTTIQDAWISYEFTNEGILSVIGNTPLIQLKKIFADQEFQLYAKLEFLNPGGSIKDRPAYYMINNALKNGEINNESTIIESSSGNLGVGLAQICKYLGMKFICVVDPKTNKQTIKLLKVYGAKVIIVEDPIDGDFLQARINMVQHLKNTIPNSYWCNQYANLNNPYAHHQTMREIVEAIGNVDYMFMAVSTCGTLRGCAEYLRNHDFSTKIIAVDAEGSLIFSNRKSKRLIPGHGAGRVPEILKPGLNDDVIHISDLDCIKGCRQLIEKESILVGGSSGGVISAINKMKDSIPVGSKCVAIFPDRGERYLETIYSDEWLNEHFGDAAFDEDF